MERVALLKSLMAILCGWQRARRGGRGHGGKGTVLAVTTSSLLSLTVQGPSRALQVSATV